MSSSLGTLFTVAWHTAVIYLLLVVGLRFAGRALMAQFTALEYLVIALLGSAVETGLYAGSASLAAGLAAATTLLVLDRLLATVLARSRRLRAALIGSPIVLVRDGRLLEPQLRRAGLTEDDVRAAIRERGYERLDQVRYAVLEVNGAVGVVPAEGRRGD